MSGSVGVTEKSEYENRGIARIIELFLVERSMRDGTPNDLARISVASDALPRRASRDLAHLPGPRGHRLLGNSRDFLPNPGQYVRDMRRRFGNCFTVGLLGNRRQVILAGPAANRLVLLDADDNFSSRWGGRC